MTKMDTKSIKMYRCNVCDKPYVKKGALTTHLKKVHNISISPTKKDFMDISNTSDLVDDLDKDNSFILEHARDLNKKDDAEELDIMLGMKSQVSFDASVLTAPSLTEESAKDIIIQSPDNSITGEPLINVALCAPAAKFLSESQKIILIPDIQESEDDNGKVKETTSIVNNVNHCKNTFTKKEVLMKHKKSNHKKGCNSAGDQRCEECSYRTNFTAHYLHHILNTHADKKLARTIKSLKPVDSTCVSTLQKNAYDSTRLIQ